MSEAPFQTEVLEDGCVKVCLTEDNITECCIVSSHHLVDGKKKQLRNAIASTAAKAYEQ